MENVLNEIREDIINFVNGKKFIPCSREELVSHFASYYDRDLVEKLRKEKIGDKVLRIKETVKEKIINYF